MFFIGLLILIILLIIYTIYKNQQHTAAGLDISFKEINRNILNLNNNLERIINLLDLNLKALDNIQRKVMNERKS